MTDPRTITLENALKALGINPDNDPIHHARRWIEGRDSDRRERDQALTERDNATARVAARDLRIKDLEGERDAARCERDQALTERGEARDMLHNIGEILGIYNRELVQWEGADHVVDVIKTMKADATARELRIKTLEGERDAALKQAEENKRRGEQYRQALNHFTIKMGLNQNADLDQHMAHVAKVCESFDTLAQIRLIFGQPADVVGVIKNVRAELNNANGRIDKAKAAFAEFRAEILKALDDYSIPTHYNATNDSYVKGDEIPVAERVRIGLMSLWAKWSEAEQKAQEASYHLDVLRIERTAAQKSLDALDAPRQAGNYDLDLAARIRALPR